VTRFAALPSSLPGFGHAVIIEPPSVRGRCLVGRGIVKPAMTTELDPSMLTLLEESVTRCATTACVIILTFILVIVLIVMLGQSLSWRL
jgi:hypothetical protein